MHFKLMPTKILMGAEFKWHLYVQQGGDGGFDLEV